MMNYLRNILDDPEYSVKDLIEAFGTAVLFSIILAGVIFFAVVCAPVNTL